MDARFLLPAFPKTAAVLHAEWAEGLRRAGVRILEPTNRQVPDLVVARAAGRDAGMPRDARMVLIEGRPGLLRGERPPGMRPYLPIPGLAQPMVVVDLSNRRAAAQALDVATHGGTAWAAAKRRLARTVLGAGLLPPIHPLYSVGAPSTIPALVREAARQAGVEIAGWFLLIEPGPDDKRLVFFVLAAGGGQNLVVKFPRLAHDRRKALREARGLETARAAGAVVVAHAPELLGDFEMAGQHATVQTAALGQTLARTVVSRRSRSHKLEQLELVAAWLREIARTTARDRRGPRADVREVVDRAREIRDAERLLAVAESCPAVFQHGDLADGNVIVDGESFVAVDWELARSDGFPLWDVVWLAVCALPRVDGARSDDEHARGLGDLFRGNAASSPVLFRWLRTTADACRMEPGAVPELITLCLLWYSTLHSRMHPEAGAAGAATWEPMERFTAEWFRDPRLGPAWPVWRARAGAL